MVRLFFIPMKVVGLLLGRHFGRNIKVQVGKFTLRLFSGRLKNLKEI